MILHKSDHCCLCQSMLHVELPASIWPPLTSESPPVSFGQ